jgi:hypothetical protein
VKVTEISHVVEIRIKNNFWHGLTSAKNKNNF